MEKGLELGVVPILISSSPLLNFLLASVKFMRRARTSPPVEVVEAIVRLHGDGLVEFGEGVVDLVEHHHAVALLA